MEGRQVPAVRSALEHCCGLKEGSGTRAVRFAIGPCGPTCSSSGRAVRSKKRWVFDRKSPAGERAVVMADAQVRGPCGLT